MAGRRYFKEVRMQQFRSLVQTARQGSFTAAARELELSRTSVWQQIRALEDDFGVELVAVVDHQPQLTAEGEQLYELLAPLVDAFDDVKETFLGQLGRIKRKLTVATTTSILNHELRQPTVEFRKKHPDIALNFIDRTSAAASELLSKAKADLAIVGRISSLPNEQTFDMKPLVQCPFFVVCHKKHPLASKRNPRITDIAKFPLILPSSGTNSRHRIDMVLEKAESLQSLQVVMQSFNTTALLSYAEENLGAALLSVGPHLRKFYNSKLCFHDMSSEFGNEDVVVIRRKTRFTRPDHQYIDSFVEMVMKANRSFSISA